MALLQNWFVPFLLMLALFALFLALIFPYLSGDMAAEKRRARWLKTDARSSSGPRIIDPVQRRKQIAESLQEVELREKAARRLTLDQRLVHAGLRISKTQFYTWSNFAGIGLAATLYLASDQSWMIVLGYFIGAFALPRAVLGILRYRRMSRFVAHFPSAIDIIVRGVRAGLPVQECLKIVAREVPEPVRGEFLIVSESQSVGLTVAEAVLRLAERVPVSEIRFFAILISVQQKSGGNLAEGLSNLSNVLRERKKLAEKIKAMSAEAKASAGIIGSLPFCVAALVHFTSPGYMDILWNTREGHLMLLVSGLWMLIGILVMRRMISFDI
jgi:tight adherence protein B